MLSKFNARSSLAITRRTFSGVAPVRRPKHIGESIAPQFYVNDFEPTTIRELEQVRSTFYDFASLNTIKEGEDAQQFITSIA
jgi:hypothetical protein